MAITKSKRIIIIDYKIEVDRTELDLKLLSDQFPDYEDDDNMDDYPQVIHENDRTMTWAGVQEMISIKDVEDVIAKIKAKGCTHMEIVHHSDHNGYYFYGAHVSNADDDKIQELRRKEDERIKASIQAKKAKLEQELKDLEKESGEK